jgi:hypothetical protein
LEPPDQEKYVDSEVMADTRICTSKIQYSTWGGWASPLGR